MSVFGSNQPLLARIVSQLKRPLGLPWPQTQSVRDNPETKPLVLYHGSRRWTGPPEVRPSRKLRVEEGPGLYLTTSYQTAAHFAKGGGIVMRFEIEPDITWLEDAVIPLQDMEAFVRDRPGMRKKNEIIQDLRRCSARTAERLGAGRCRAATLLNLMVNYNAITGEHGPALASFFASHGIHASLAKSDSQEDWVVIFDMGKIRSYKPWPAKLVDESNWDLPRIKNQLALRQNPTVSEGQGQQPKDLRGGMIPGTKGWLEMTRQLDRDEVLVYGHTDKARAGDLQGFELLPGQEVPEYPGWRLVRTQRPDGYDTLEPWYPGLPVTRKAKGHKGVVSGVRWSGNRIQVMFVYPKKVHRFMTTVETIEEGRVWLYSDEIEYSPDTRRNPRTRRFVHVTPWKNWASIKKQGLRPKLGHRGGYADDPTERRIYLFEDEVTAEDALANWMCDLYDDVRYYAILEVTVLQDSYLHDDPELSGSYYTTKPISAQNIRLIQKLDAGEDD